MPGQAKIVSVTTEKAITEPISRPSTVTIGIRMFLSTWTQDHAARPQALGARELDVVHVHDLARARRGEPDDQGDAREREVDRRQQDQVLEPVPGEEADDRRRARCTVAPRPVEGSQPSSTANTMISMMPTQKVGRLKPRIEPAAIVRARASSRLQPGVEPERQAEHHRHARMAEKASSSVAGRRSTISLQRRLVEHEGIAEIAVQRIAEEEEVLLPERLVEAERRGGAARSPPGPPAG